MKRNYFLLCLLVLSVSVLAADLVPVPEGDPLVLLLDLIKNWKASTPIAIGSMIVVIIVQVLKKFVGESLYTRASVTVLGVAYSILVTMQKGASLLEAAIMALLVSGGAVAIYEAISPLINKPKEA